MAASDEVDLNFKMSKKIAQLTKVIYQLNCRNEDGDVYARSVAERYESEISSIMADAKDKLTSLRDALNAQQNDDKIQRVIKDMTKIHQKEKDEATRMFDEFRERVLQNEQAMKQNFESRIVAMTRELGQCKDDFAKAIKDSTATVRKEYEDVIARKAKETEDLVKEYNERYKTMLAEQLDAQDQLEKRLNEEWGKKVAALQAQLNGKTTDLNKMLAEEQARCAKLQQELKEAHTEMTKRQQIIDDRDTDLTRLKQRLEHFEGTVMTLSAQAKKAEELSAALQSKLSSTEVELRDANARNLNGEKTMAELRQTLASAEASLANLQQAHAKSLSDNTALVNEKSVLETKVASLEAQLHDLLSEKAKLGDMGSSMGSEIARLTEQLRQTESSLLRESQNSKALAAELSIASAARQQLEDQIAALRQKHDAHIASLAKQHEDALSQLRANSNASGDELARRHKAELEALRSEMDADKKASLLLLEKQLGDELSAQSKELTAKIDAMKLEAEARLASEVRKRQEETAALQAVIDDLKQKLSGDATSAQREIERLRDEMAALKEAHSKVVSDLDAKLKKATDDLHVESKIAKEKLEASAAETAKERNAKEAALKVAAEVPILKERIRALEEQHAKELAAAAEKFAKQLADATSGKDKDSAEQMRVALEKLRQELTEKHNKDITALQREHTGNMNALKSQLDKSQGDLTKALAEIERLVAERNASSANSSAAMDSLRQQLEAARLEYEANLKRLNGDHAREMAEATASLTAKHEQDVKDLRDAQAKLVAEFEAKLLRLGDDARLAQRDMEENFKNRVTSLEKRKDEERERAVKEVDELLNKQLTELKGQAARELEDMRNAKHVVERDVVALTAEVAAAKRNLDETKARLDAEVAQSKANAAAAAAERTSLLESYEKKLSALNTKSQADLQQLQSAHDAAIASLQGEFESEKKQLHAKIKQLQKLVADLEYKYANRESRQEDVDRINQLMKEAKEKDDALIKAYNDMKFYKLELVNREDNYNKMFGRQPSIANMSGAADSAVGGAGSMQSKPQQNPTSAPSKMDNANMPPNMRRKSFAADK